MLRLETFGGLALTSDGTARPQPRRRMALLAVLAPSGERGVSRDELLAYFWPERDADTARHSLDQLLYEMRRALGASPAAGSGSLRLDPEVIASDVAEFSSAVARGEHAEAVALYRGPFLQGFYLQGSPEFERWVESAREQLAAEYRRALEALARNATASGRRGDAVAWWRRLAADDRVSSRAALGLMRALADAGDRAGALEYARVHERIVRAELDAAPDPAVTAFAEELRTAAPVGATTPRETSPSAVAAERPAGAVAPVEVSAPPRQPNRRALLYSAAAVVLAVALYGAIGLRRGRAAAVARAADAPGGASIAVLPLADMSADGASGPFADGMTEELIAVLGRTDGLRVTASTSAFAFKGHHTDVRRIADSLGVSTILEGGVQREGSRMRLTVRLVDAASGTTRWSQVYDRELRDVFAVEDSIGRAVARELRLRLLGDPSAPLVRHQTASVAAYELYLRGTDPLLLRSDSGVRAATDYFSRAVALDSSYAAAYAGLAHMYANAAWGGNQLPPRERRALYARAESAAHKALALDDSLPEAHTELGYVKLLGYDLPAAVTEFGRALALDSNAGRTREYLTRVYAWAGRPGDMVAEAQRSLRADPLSASANAELAYALYFARRYDEALVQLRRVAAIRPPLRRTMGFAVEIYAARRQWPDAIAVLRAAGPQAYRASALLGYVLARSGDRAEATRILRQILAGVQGGSTTAFDVAEVYAGLGDLDHAFAWLDRSIDDYSLRVNVMGPMFDDLRADPRFGRVRRRLGLQKL